jgi:hypothetical protein
LEATFTFKHLFQMYLNTTLRSYPGLQHWHLRKPGRPGTLEITCWPTGKRVWLAVHTNRQGGWIADVVPRMKAWLEEEGALMISL